jgi:hypothetical protein
MMLLKFREGMKGQKISKAFPLQRVVECLIMKLMLFYKHNHIFHRQFPLDIKTSKQNVFHKKFHNNCAINSDVQVIAPSAH